jgi:glycosyltransferase involved in cell wall biosynthesis
MLVLTFCAEQIKRPFQITAAKMIGLRLKVLWVKSELLHPVDKGGKIRTLEMLKQLKRDHHVTYVCLENPGDTAQTRAEAAEYCHELVTIPWSEPPRFSVGFYWDLFKNVFSALPYVIQKYQSPKMYDYVAAKDASGEFDVIVCDFLTPSASIPKQLRAASVVFEHNVESILWQRTYQNEANLAKKAYFYLQYAKMHSYEQMLCNRYEAVAAVSENDAKDIARLFKTQDVFAVPTGVDSTFFAPPAEADPQRPYSTLAPRKNNLVFTGSMDWMPNEDAILYFAEQILPIIATKVPDVTVTVVGRNPTPKLLALAKVDSRIELTGRVDDVRPYIERGSVYIVPMRVGGGTRIKIYEAMGMAKAVVSTSIGAEGLPVRGGYEIVFADDPDQFAQDVIQLLEKESARNEIGANARRAVVERFGWKSATDALVSAMNRALEKKRLAVS